MASASSIISSVIKWPHGAHTICAEHAQPVWATLVSSRTSLKPRSITTIATSTIWRSTNVKSATLGFAGPRTSLTLLRVARQKWCRLRLPDL